MAATSKFRGNTVEEKNGSWVYSDTKEIVNWRNHVCGHCSKARTIEGHDACLGTLRSAKNGGVMNACCGHGTVDEAYVQFWDRSRISGNEAMAFFKQR